MPVEMLMGALLLLCFASVPLFGGRLGRLAELRFRRPQIVLAALLFQIVVIEIIPDGNRTLVAGTHVFTYALLMVFMSWNIHLPGVLVVWAGGLLNAMAITLNGGVMPARPGALTTAGLEPAADTFTNSGVVAQPLAPWLGDSFAIPSSVPLANVFSVGDVLILIGCALLMHRVCGSHAPRWVPQPLLRRGPRAAG